MSALVTIAATLAAFGSPGSLSAQEAPTPQGAERPPSYVQRAEPGHPVWLSGICPGDARPSDVTTTDAQGRQYRNGRTWRRWQSKGRIVATRTGDRVTARRPVYVAAWCE
jgi:hypothetical protein